MSISWNRTNFHGRNVSLLGGIALAGMLAATHIINAARGDRYSARIALAAAGSAAAGFYDDMSDEQTRNKNTKGLHGHIGALKEGRLSPGLIKMFALITIGLWTAKPRRDLVDWVAEAGVIAGGANLVNLVDLRPGRALKVASLAALAGFVSVAGEKDNTARRWRALLNLENIAAAFPLDLREITMLGDAGANALGATLGATWAQGRTRGAKLVALIVIAALTLASEKVSFSKVIENTPWLKALDNLGRRQDDPLDTAERAPETENISEPANDTLQSSQESA